MVSSFKVFSPRRVEHTGDILTTSPLRFILMVDNVKVFPYFFILRLWFLVSSFKVLLNVADRTHRRHLSNFSSTFSFNVWWRKSSSLFLPFTFVVSRYKVFSTWRMEHAGDIGNLSGTCSFNVRKCYSPVLLFLFSFTLRLWFLNFKVFSNCRPEHTGDISADLQVYIFIISSTVERSCNTFSLHVWFAVSKKSYVGGRRMKE